MVIDDIKKTFIEQKKKDIIGYRSEDGCRYYDKINRETKYTKDFKLTSVTFITRYVRKGIFGDQYVGTGNGSASIESLGIKNKICERVQGLYGNVHIGSIERYLKNYRRINLDSFYDRINKEDQRETKHHRNKVTKI